MPPTLLFAPQMFKPSAIPECTSRLKSAQSNSDIVQSWTDITFGPDKQKECYFYFIFHIFRPRGASNCNYLPGKI